MAAHRQCFYCKQSFQSLEFHTHLKQCPARAVKHKPKPMNPGPMQSTYHQNSSQNRWTCPMCSFQCPASMAVCNMCQQGKRPPMMQQQQQVVPQQQFISSHQPPPPPNSNNQYGMNNMNSGYPPMQQQYQNPNLSNMSNMNGNLNHNAMNGLNQMNQSMHAMGSMNQQQHGLPPPKPPQQQQQEQQYWECQSCTFVNSVMSASCKICSNPQPKKQNPRPLNNNNNGMDQDYGNGPNGNGSYSNSSQSMNGLKKGPPPVPDNVKNNYDQNGNYGNRGPMRSSFSNGNGQNDIGNDFGNDFGNKPNNNGSNQNEYQPDPNDTFDYAAYQGVAQEPDEATAALIAQMMAQSMCFKCGKNQGFEMPCGCNFCGPCAKAYIKMGIPSKKWEKQPLKCPGDCNDGLIPLWVVRDCGLEQKHQESLEKMQNAYMIASDPSMTTCPTCKETYSTEQGDIRAEITNKAEKGLDGKIMSMAHKQHKAKFRFRCGKPGCKTIFCSGCGATPYHMGYTCEEYQSYQDSKKCRFCEVTLGPNNTAPPDFSLKEGLSAVCTKPECMEKRRWSCDLVHPCGHNCIGLMGHDCIGCLHPDCAPKNADVVDEDFCNICWVDPLRAAPCVELECGHFFHFMCLWQKIDRKWPAARITFGFLNCPLCKQEIHHPALDDITSKYYNLKKEIEHDAIERVKIEGLQNDKRLKDKNSPYFENLPKFAMDRLAFYKCFKCEKPYFGGMKACEEAGAEQAESYKQDHLVCGSCASGPNAKSCKKHGKKYITYKCKFCCNVSSWYCWGSTHFCDACHKKQEEGDYLNRKPISELPKCPGVDQCPLGIEHPPNGTAEFSLGCVVCLRK